MHFADKKERDGTLEAMASAIDAAAAAAAKAGAIRDALHADITLPAEAKQRAIRDQARKAAAAGVAAIDRAHGQCLGEIDRIAGVIFAPPPVRDSRELFQEQSILQALRSMKATDRMKAINAALTENDDTVLSAVLNSNRLLSGLTAAEINMIRERFARERYPDAAVRLQRLQKAREALTRGSKVLEGFVEGLYDAALANAADASVARTAKAIAAE
ncbi:MAG: hypothetical protein EOS85_11555 [Mesorhizobium sp.]|nr:MAG: hypothetical protein EOS85_11555 [Mesorhizobium sp.]